MRQGIFNSHARRWKDFCSRALATHEMHSLTHNLATEQAASAKSVDARLWRREPYRILFPLGVALTWAGVFHWLLLAIGVLEEYRSIFHAMAQIQGFMTCFVVGFLYTFIPRRTGTPPPSAWQMAVAMVAPVAITASAWLEYWALSQLFWLVLLGTIIAFAFRRVRQARFSSQSPISFVWIPISLLIGVGAAILTGGAAMAGPDYMWLHDLGRGLLLQGMLTGLVIGIGGMLLPVIIRGEPIGARPSSAPILGRFLHLSAGLLFIGSYWIEFLVSVQLGFALRAAVCIAALAIPARSWRWPTLPGLHRRFIWLAAWMLPVGYAFVAALPQYRKVGLHIVFIGGFVLLALSVSIHVIFSHAGRSDLLNGDRWPLKAMGILLLLALGARATVDFDQAHFHRWLGLAASLFLAGTVCWLVLVLPTLLKPIGFAQRAPIARAPDC